MTSLTSNEVGYLFIIKGIALLHYVDIDDETFVVQRNGRSPTQMATTCGLAHSVSILPTFAFAKFNCLNGPNTINMCHTAHSDLLL